MKKKYSLENILAAISSWFEKLEQSNMITVYCSYFSVLYFFEILYLLFPLNLLYGKAVSFSFGFLLSILLSVHIICLYSRFEVSRIIQLFLMELHVAYSIPFFIQFASMGYAGNIIETIIIAFRFNLCCIGILFIVLLTGSKDRNIVPGGQLS